MIYYSLLYIIFMEFVFINKEYTYYLDIEHPDVELVRK